MGSTADESAIFALQDMQEPLNRRLVGGECCLLSRSYPGKEGPNEDSAAILTLGNGCTVFAVADGAGGQPSGDKASLGALKALRENLAGVTTDEGDLRNGILSGFEAANQSVLDLGVGAGTTLTVVAIEDTSVRPFHVGDSEVLLVGQRGKVKIQTVSHSPVGYAHAAGMLTDKQAIQHEDRHLISNLLGSEDMHIQVGPVRRMAPRDTLVLGSDGLFDNLLLHEIAECVRVGPLADAGNRLGEICLGRMADPVPGTPSKPDDFTFVLYRRTR